MQTVHIATKSGKEFDRYFPKPQDDTYIIKRFAKLEDTLAFIPKAIEMTLFQTERIAPLLKGNTPFETFRKVWNFAYDHISYRKDKPGKEQIQSPAVTWALRAGDCDDYMTFITSILCNLGYKVIIRTAMYTEENGYQHIYPVSLLVNGVEIPMDCVAQRFNYEVPYIKKIDNIMELQFLNGLPETRINISNSVDTDDLLQGLEEYEIEEMGELGKGKLKSAVSSAVKKVTSSAPVKKAVNVVNKVQTSKVGQKATQAYQKVNNSKIVQAAKKGVHAVNRVNPAAALLRAGILIALKTNILNVAERLRFTYLSPQQAQAQGLDQDKLHKVTNIRQRLEKIFFGAGGKIENFKESILKGKGNHDKKVPLAGLGYIDYNNYTLQDSPELILGIDSYNSEIASVEGLGELGIATEAAIAAATSAMAAIAGLLKAVGDFRKKAADKKATAKQGAEASSQENPSDTQTYQNETPGSGENNSNTGEESNNSNSFTDQNQSSATDSNQDSSNRNGADNNKETPTETFSQEDSKKTSANQENETNESSGNSQDSSQPGSGSGANARTVATNEKEKGFFDKAVDWVKKNPVPTLLIVVVASGIIYAVAKAVSSSGDKKTKGESALAGTPNKRTRKEFVSRKIRFQKLR